MEVNKYTIKVFKGEEEISSIDNVEDIIVFGLRSSEEDSDKTNVMLFSNESISNAALYLLSRTIIDRFDDGLAIMLAAGSMACTDESGISEIIGEITSDKEEGEEDEWETQ